MGVYTADPLILPSAKLIPHLQYDMLNELIENTGNRRIISRRAFNLLKQHNISIAFRDFKIPNLPNSTLINNQNVNEPFFLIINSLENNLFITTDKNLISSSDFYRIYNFLDQTHIIVNDLFFDNARVILKSHELKIINDISLIFIVSNIIEKEGFVKIIELMKTNAIIVYSYVFQDSSLSSFLIIQQDRHELAIRLINEFLEKIYEQKH
jgi:aspartokinase